MDRKQLYCPESILVLMPWRNFICRLHYLWDTDWRTAEKSRWDPPLPFSWHEESCEEYKQEGEEGRVDDSNIYRCFLKQHVIRYLTAASRLPTEKSLFTDVFTSAECILGLKVNTRVVQLCLHKLLIVVCFMFHTNWMIFYICLEEFLLFS